MNKREIIAQNWKELRFSIMYPKNSIGRQQVLKTLQFVTNNQETAQLLLDYEEKHNCILLGCLENECEFIFEAEDREIFFKLIQEIEDEK